jgi:hypothetical protein
MANIFNITVAATDIKADAEGKATAIFTVTNALTTPVRGIAKAKALGNTQQDWLTVKGEQERDLSAHGTEQFTVEFSKPAIAAIPGAPAAPPEKFPFRLDVFSASNPDEQFTEGPTVNVEVQQAVVTVKKPFPWWILIVAGVVLILVVVLLFFLLSGKKDGGNNNNTVPSTPVAITFTLELTTDRAGSDYKLIELPQPTFELCRDACATDSKCRAYSYVNPGVQAPNARCYLKAPAPPATKNACCISGVKN